MNKNRTSNIVWHHTKIKISITICEYKDFERQILDWALTQLVKQLLRIPVEDCAVLYCTFIRQTSKTYIRNNTVYRGNLPLCTLCLKKPLSTWPRIGAGFYLTYKFQVCKYELSSTRMCIYSLKKSCSDHCES